MIIKKIFSLVASIISLFIIIFFFIPNSNAEENNFKLYSKDEGVLSIMYHRFNEFKYPSTNISMNFFKEHIELIEASGFSFYHPKDFENDFDTPKKDKKILLTIDDAFLSFYQNAWPYLKKNKIPFILFVSTDPVGKKGYMNWDQIRTVEKENFAYIGNHSHSHEYLVNYGFDEFSYDINKSIEIFKSEIGYNPIFFSYPFGEYNLKQKNFIKNKFEYAFGQHSGVIDLNKDKFELPRFPINEKYGDLDRFNFLTKLLPLQYKNLEPEQKLLNEKNNPPNIKIEFFKNQKNLDKINCFSNEGGDWKDAELNLNEHKLSINLKENFKPRRGRINCSLKDEDGWRWFGVQFIVN